MLFGEIIAKTTRPLYKFEGSEQDAIDNNYLCVVLLLRRRCQPFFFFLSVLRKRTTSILLNYWYLPKKPQKKIVQMKNMIKLHHDYIKHHE